MVNTIELRNGNTLAYKTLEEHERKTIDLNAELECLLEHAFFFYAHREYFYQDSKLFLIRIPLFDKLTRYTAPMKGVMGGLLEWWEHCDASAYILDGEPALFYNFQAVANLIGAGSTAVITRSGKKEAPWRSDLLERFLSLRFDYQKSYADTDAWKADTRTLQEAYHYLKDKEGLSDHTVDTEIRAHFYQYECQRQQRLISDLDQKLFRLRVATRREAYLTYISEKAKLEQLELSTEETPELLAQRQKVQDLWTRSINIWSWTDSKYSLDLTAEELDDILEEYRVSDLILHE